MALREDFEKLGQRNFLKKPYTLDALGRCLRKILDEGKA